MHDRLAAHVSGRIKAWHLRNQSRAPGLLSLTCGGVMLRSISITLALCSSPLRRYITASPTLNSRRRCCCWWCCCVGVAGFSCGARAARAHAMHSTQRQSSSASWSSGLRLGGVVGVMSGSRSLHGRLRPSGAGSICPGIALRQHTGRAAQPLLAGSEPRIPGAADHAVELCIHHVIILCLLRHCSGLGERSTRRACPVKRSKAAVVALQLQCRCCQVAWIACRWE